MQPEVHCLRDLILDINQVETRTPMHNPRIILIDRLKIKNNRGKEAEQSEMHSSKQSVLDTNQVEARKPTSSLCHEIRRKLLCKLHKLARTELRELNWRTNHFAL